MCPKGMCVWDCGVSGGRLHGGMEKRGVIMRDKRGVEYWYNNAEEARVIARSMKYEATRQIMLELAADFDRVARLALECQLMTEKRANQEETELRTSSEIAEILMNV